MSNDDYLYFIIIHERSFDEIPEEILDYIDSPNLPETHYRDSMTKYRKVLIVGTARQTKALTRRVENKIGRSLFGKNSITSIRTLHRTEYEFLSKRREEEAAAWA